MFAKWLTLAVFVVSLGLFAQSDNQSPKQDLKDAGSSTKKAAKKTGHAVKQGTQKGVHKTAHATKKGAQKLENKTEPAPSATPK